MKRAAYRLRRKRKIMTALLVARFQDRDKPVAILRHAVRIRRRPARNCASNMGQLMAERAIDFCADVQAVADLAKLVSGDNQRGRRMF